jgi:hypothetical protein
MKKRLREEDEIITIDSKRTKQEETYLLEQIPQDVIGYIFEFLYLNDVMNFGFTNKHLSQFLESNSPIWKEIASYYCTSSSSAVIDTTMYKEIIKEESLLRFDTSCIDTESVSNGDVTFSNNNRTCKGGNRWTTIKTKKEIEDGALYSWDYILDLFACNNAYKIIIGLENDDFPFLSQNSSMHAIGYIINSDAYAYNCGISKLITPDSRYDTETIHRFEAGNTIRCIVDTTSPQCSLENASFSLYKIVNTASDPILIAKLKNLDLKTTGCFYPALSLFHSTQVTLRLNSII